MIAFQPGDSRAFWELARFAKKEISLYESEFGKLKLEAVWWPTALQGLNGEQNVGVATTNGAIRLLHASYSLIPDLLENTELILRKACEDTRD